MTGDVAVDRSGHGRGSECECVCESGDMAAYGCELLSSMVAAYVYVSQSLGVSSFEFGQLLLAAFPAWSLSLFIDRTKAR